MTTRTSARIRLATLGLAVALVGCLEISSPTDEIESISPVIAAYPAVVAGDTLRDSLGVAQPLQLFAFTGRGDTAGSLEGLRFILPDTGVDARVQDRYFIAGARLGGVRVFGQIAGLQTPPETLFVVPPPVRAMPDPETLGNPATVATARYSPTQATISSPSLSVRVQGDTAGVPVNLTGWVVSYRIVEQPARNPLIESGVPAFFPSTQGREPRADSTVAADTTANGVATRTVTVAPSFLEGFPTAVDTVVVEATVRYRGAHVPGSPITFRIPIAPQQ